MIIMIVLVPAVPVRYGAGPWQWPGRARRRGHRDPASTVTVSDPAVTPRLWQSRPRPGRG